MDYAFWADVLVTVHAAYVGFVVLGQLIILAGLALGWGWVRNRWFRLAHLLAILVVGLEAVLQIDCPLTVWEGRLRRLAGQDVTADSFVGRCFRSLLFLDLPSWAFPVLHVGFALLVLGTFVLAPPRWRASSRRLPAA